LGKTRREGVDQDVAVVAGVEIAVEIAVLYLCRRDSGCARWRFDPLRSLRSRGRMRKSARGV
ncbi:hypothetical protein, partial [Mesorhizobium sp. M3A.F.Ca.ET.174.01.1.1]|uniref:hypothetical protein n=1 Tax=Mesorhizobium sp. M3A.F.Ca.ET.174.01.1.1 TaxID=2563944 RepID=UPI001AEEF073